MATATNPAFPELESVTKEVVSAELKKYYNQARTVYAEAAAAGATSQQRSNDSVLNIAALSYMTVAQKPSDQPDPAVQAQAWKAVADATITEWTKDGKLEPPKSLRASQVATIIRSAASKLMQEQTVTTLGGGTAQRDRAAARMRDAFSQIDRLKIASYATFVTEAKSVAALKYDGGTEVVFTDALLKYAAKLVVPYAHARFLTVYAAPASSFYDQRVASMLLLDALVRGITALIDNRPSAGGVDAEADKLTQLQTALVSLRYSEYALAGTGGADSPLFKRYNNTAVASADARTATAELVGIQSSAGSRATRIASLQWNVAQAEAAARRARLVLVAWIATLFVAVAVAVLLIVRAPPAAVYAYAATVIGTVLTLGIVTVGLRSSTVSRMGGAVL